jgi:pilus assembly protein Flp/PilA
MRAWTGCPPKPQKEKKMKRFMSFLKDEDGVSAIEYGLIASLVAVALIVGATAMGGKLNTLFTETSGKM